MTHLILIIFLSLIYVYKDYINIIKYKIKYVNGKLILNVDIV